MAKRRKRYRISIRLGLIIISMIGVLLAIYIHYQSAGERRSKAVSSLSEIGTAAFSDTAQLDFSNVSFTGVGMGGVTLAGPVFVFPEVIQKPPSTVSVLGRRVFGNEIFTDYAALLV